MRRNSSISVARAFNPCRVARATLLGTGYKPVLHIFASLLLICPTALATEELLPKFITPPTQKGIKNGLDYLAKQQSPDGNYPNSPDGAEYAVTMTSLAGMAFLANGNTPNRG